MRKDNLFSRKLKGFFYLSYMWDLILRAHFKRNDLIQTHYRHLESEPKRITLALLKWERQKAGFAPIWPPTWHKSPLFWWKLPLLPLPHPGLLYPFTSHVGNSSELGNRCCRRRSLTLWIRWLGPPPSPAARAPGGRGDHCCHQKKPTPWLP